MLKAWAALLGLLLCAVGRVEAASNTTRLVTDAGWAFYGTWWRPGKTGCSGEPLNFSNTTGNYLTATFTGTDVYLQTTYAYDRGVISIEIDGQADGDYNEWLDDPTQQLWECGTLYSRHGLANGQHELKATLSAAHNGIAKFEVMSITFTTPDASDGAPSSSNNPPPQTTPPQTNPPPAATNTPAPANTNTQPSAGTTAPGTSAGGQSSSNAPSQAGGSGAVILSSGAPAGSSTAGAINAAATADISVVDPRIQWSPANAWTDGVADTSVSSCSTGTRLSKTPGASLTFPFKGTAISLKTAASNSSGLYTVALDGQAPESQDGFSSSQTGCNPQTKWTKNGLSDTNHVLVVTLIGASTANGNTGGTRLEIAGLTYYGQDAQGTVAYTAAQPGPSSNQAAVIGGSVGGVLGALLIAGIGTFFFLRHRHNKSAAAAQNGITPHNGGGGPPMMQPQRTGSLTMSPNRVFADPRSGNFAFQPGGIYQDPSSAAAAYPHHQQQQPARNVYNSSPSAASTSPTSGSTGQPYPYTFSPFSPTDQQGALASSTGRSSSPTATSGRSVPGLEQDLVRVAQVGGGQPGLQPPKPPQSPPPAYAGDQHQSLVMPPIPPIHHTYNNNGVVLH